MSCPALSGAAWTSPNYDVPAYGDIAISVAPAFVPSSATMALIQFAVQGSLVPSGCTVSLPSSNGTFGAVVQVPGVWNCIAGIAPLWPDLTIHVHNWASQTVTVQILVYGYA